MISNEMYRILSKIPLPTEATDYDTLKDLCDMQQLKLDHLLIQARSPVLGYIFADPDSIRGSIISLTEKGIIEIEEYERMKSNQAMMETSFEISKKAMWAAIASAITSAIALLITIFK